MHNALDVITIGEAMAMFVATETGDLAGAGALYQTRGRRRTERGDGPGASGLERRLGQPRRR